MPAESSFTASTAPEPWVEAVFRLKLVGVSGSPSLVERADISAPPEERPAPDDGFAEVRKQLAAQARRYRGKLLLVDSAPLAKDQRPAIEWRDNIGHLSLGESSVEVRVTPGSDTRFAVAKPEPASKKKQK